MGMVNMYLDEDFIMKAATEALTRPSDFGYYGTLPLFHSWGFTFSQSRDSDALGRSNYRTILRDLRAHAARLTDDPEEYVQEIHCNHWLVGWMDHIVVKVLINGDPEDEEDYDIVDTIYDGNPVKYSNISPVFMVAANIADSLENGYAVWDDMDYSELEYEEDWAAFESEWEDMLARWDVEDDGPEPTDDEKEAIHSKLTEQGAPEDGYWHSDLADAVLEMRGTVRKVDVFTLAWMLWLDHNPEVSQYFGNHDTDVRWLLDNANLPYDTDAIDTIIVTESEKAAHKFNDVLNAGKTSTWL